MNLLISQDEIFLLTYTIYLFILFSGKVPFQKHPLGQPQDEIPHSGPHLGVAPTTTHVFSNYTLENQGDGREEGLERLKKGDSSGGEESWKKER